MIDWLRGLMTNILGFANARLALFADDLSTEMQRAVRVLLLALVALSCAALGLLMLAVTVILAVDPQQRALASALVAVAFLGAAALAFWQARRAVAESRRRLEARLSNLVSARATPAVPVSAYPERTVALTPRALRWPIVVAGSGLLVVLLGPASAARLASRALVVLGWARRVIRLRDALRP